MKNQCSVADNFEFFQTGVGDIAPIKFGSFCHFKVPTWKILPVRLLLQGGSGGRIVNISSMAGFTTRDLEVAGYTAAKTGVIALTRSFETSIPNVFSMEGIKAYALCPFFANTVLLTDRISITGHFFSEYFILYSSASSNNFKFDFLIDVFCM